MAFGFDFADRMLQRLDTEEVDTDIVIDLDQTIDLDIASSIDGFAFETVSVEESAFGTGFASASFFGSASGSGVSSVSAIARAMPFHTPRRHRRGSL